MRSPPKTREPCVQYADPEGPGGIDILPETFLRECLDSARARFRTGTRVPASCPTVVYTVPPKFGDPGPTGQIVAHLSPALVSAWQKALTGPPQLRRQHVEEQVRLALEDLGLQDTHGLLALTPSQRACYVLDLSQLVAEAFDRTTFSRLGRIPLAHWEGTLVSRLRPPFVVLVVSVRLAPTRPRPRTAAQARAAGPTQRSQQRAPRPSDEASSRRPVGRR